MRGLKSPLLVVHGTELRLAEEDLLAESYVGPVMQVEPAIPGGQPFRRAREASPLRESRSFNSSCTMRRATLATMKE